MICHQIFNSNTFLLLPVVFVLVTYFFSGSVSTRLPSSHVTSSNSEHSWKSHSHKRSISLSFVSGSRCIPEEIEWEKDGKCYPRSSQGPCGNNMILVPTPEHNNLARCVCNVQRRKRPLIYSLRNDQCYEIYTTGPCMSENWLVIKDGKQACERNPCLYFTFHVDYAGREFVSYKEECVELYKPSELCSEGQVISFSTKKNTRYEVVCDFKVGVQPLSLAPPEFSCPAGQALDINSQCREIIEFDFDP